MYYPKCDCIVTETTVTGSKKCLRCLYEWWVPSQSRTKNSFESDCVAIQKTYKDVVEHKKSVGGSGR